ncbi:MULTISPECIES: hypothetical protein [Curtobacterium]|uniref:hypothetical protein n=1 Tax=Curtobacterium TaxID=2034 RepID=UPI0012E09095|nr:MULTISPECIES: hypothetical protein [Curtobacterium]MDD1385469.1 hypothetical protein [Curtobacterium flaccumfaciens pv. poinsettiae]MDQ0541044.1 hypothetical protein [Curtobacterium flaccumfaciens]UXZ58031.1 hypothetical protein MXD64_01220 [Curtobacterium sp. Arg-1]
MRFFVFAAATQSPAPSDAALLPTWIGAIATAVGVVVAIIAIGLTYRQVRLTAKQLRHASVQAAQDSEDRTRPYVAMNIVPSIASSGALDLVITNTGATAATNVRFELVDAQFGLSDDDTRVGPDLRDFFSTPFELAPGARMRLFWHLPESTADHSDKPGAMGAPVTGELRATYSRDVDGRPGTQEYVTKHHYDFTLWPKITPQAWTGKTNEGSPSDSLTHLKNIAFGIRAVAHHLGETNR